MSELAIDLPRPVHYAEKPVEKTATLDRVVNDLIGHLVVARSSQRAKGLAAFAAKVEALDAEFRALDAAALDARRRQIAIALRRYPDFPRRIWCRPSR